jgi:hypothetical protein
MVDGRRELGDGQENVTAPSAPPCLDEGQPTSTGITVNDVRKVIMKRE